MARNIVSQYNKSTRQLQLTKNLYEIHFSLYFHHFCFVFFFYPQQKCSGFLCSRKIKFLFDSFLFHIVSCMQIVFVNFTCQFLLFLCWLFVFLANGNNERKSSPRICVSLHRCRSIDFRIFFFSNFYFSTKCFNGLKTISILFSLDSLLFLRIHLEALLFSLILSFCVQCTSRSRSNKFRKQKRKKNTFLIHVQ